MPLREAADRRLAKVDERDRTANISLLGAAVAAWLVVGLLFATRSPVGDPAVQASGAVALGGAVALTATPLFWLTAFAWRHRIARDGDWARALRRGLLVGGIVSVLVTVRILDIFSLPIALFIVAMGLFIELILSGRR